MRVRLIFKLKNRGGVVPFHHQHLFARQIKGLIFKNDKKEFIDFKTYNFSGIKGQTRVSRKGLHFFSSKVTIVLSSPNKAFIDFIITSIFNLKQLEIGSLMLVPELVEKEVNFEIESPTKFICISPIVLTKPEYGDRKGKRFIPPDLDLFSDLLYDSTLHRMAEETSLAKSKLEAFYKFQIVPDVKYLNRLDQQQKKYARIYSVYENDVKYEVRGYTFPFELYAEKEVLEFIYSSGLGYFAHKGFGMLDMASGAAMQKTELYPINLEQV
ncbi:MAG: CRISPR-associated endoribonuclease Cas6 [Cyclobacteriaceae bacterium]|nr:CRISPR-associated endoribonuclease Cas6 [Cyclobacteriaceae bacterium]